MTDSSYEPVDVLPFHKLNVGTLLLQLCVFTRAFAGLCYMANSRINHPPIPDKPMSHFSENLRSLCRTQPSVSHICREIGINRQQFERYLQGRSLPSSHNTYRICRYFGVPEKSLFVSPDEFEQTRTNLRPDFAPSALLDDLFPGDLSVLRNYLGIYHSHFVNRSWPDMVQRALCIVTEHDGKILTRYIGRVKDPQSSLVYRSKFRGLMSVHGDRLFLLERGNAATDALAQTILMPPERHRAAYVTGLAFMMAWRPRRIPFCSRIIWKRLPDRTDYREAIRACGLVDPKSRVLDPVIRSFLTDTSVPFLSL